MHVLIVSDDENWIEDFDALLTHHGYRTTAMSVQDMTGQDDRHRWQTLVFDGNTGSPGQIALRRHGGWRGDAKIPAVVSIALDSQQRQGWLEAGADAFLPHVIDAPSVLVTLARCQEMVTLYQQSEATTQRLRILRSQLQENLYSASLVQRDLLPDPQFSFPGLSIAWFIESCEDLGGDLVSLLPLDEHRLAFAVIDVAGHGAKAAILGVQISRRFRSSASPWDSGINPDILSVPQRLAELFNHEFPMDYRSLQFFTMCYGVIDARTGICQYVGCGHPAPLLVGQQGSVRELPSLGHPIGILPHTTAVFQQQEVQLQPGESLVFYSDGLSEALNAQGDILDVEGISAALRTASPDARSQIAALQEAARTWRECNAVSDDSTALVISR
ncbi:MAG: hypothetical protein EA401_06785 [Planctomycetota bacterium]|nr:MAG: hypothetical protein EA401_06785 [Planctomycetota bacterium]